MENEIKQRRPISKEIRGKAAGYIGAGLGVVAGLAWNDAISSLIKVLFPLAKDTIIAKFIYAVIITTVVVFVSMYAIRLIEGKKE